MHRKLKIGEHDPKIAGDERKCSERVSSSCSTCGTRRVTLVVVNTCIVCDYTYCVYSRHARDSVVFKIYDHVYFI